MLGLLCMLGGSLCFSLMALVAAELGSGRATPHHKFEPFEWLGAGSGFYSYRVIDRIGLDRRPGKLDR